MLIHARSQTSIVSLSWFVRKLSMNPSQITTGHYGASLLHSQSLDWLDRWTGVYRCHFNF